MTRKEAFEAFLRAVVEAIPEDKGTDWPKRRGVIRDAGVAYAHAAAVEAAMETRQLMELCQ